MIDLKSTYKTIPDKELITMENKTTPATENVEVVGTVSDVPTENKPKLVKEFVASKCKTCGGDKIFIPKYGRNCCVNCTDINMAATGSANPEEYLTANNHKLLRHMDSKSKYTMFYRNPESNPFYHFQGRNELCACGSGKKFKKCCMATKTQDIEAHLLKEALQKRENLVYSEANEVKYIIDLFNHRALNGWEKLEESKFEFTPLVASNNDKESNSDTLEASVEG